MRLIGSTNETLAHAIGIQVESQGVSWQQHSRSGIVAAEVRPHRKVASRILSVASIRRSHAFTEV